MNLVPFPIPKANYHCLAFTTISYDVMLKHLGEPHFLEDDETRTAGGHDAVWAWEENGTIIFFEYALSYKRGGYGVSDISIESKLIDNMVETLIPLDYFEQMEPFLWI